MPLDPNLQAPPHYPMLQKARKLRKGPEVSVLKTMDNAQVTWPPELIRHLSRPGTLHKCPLQGELRLAASQDQLRLGSSHSREHRRLRVRI